MRKILFRGKSIKTNEWIYGNLLINYKNSGVNIINPTETKNLFQIKSETICQYTGLSDKCGCMIFEGDIVMEPYTGEMGTIMWSENTASYYIKWENSNLYGRDLCKHYDYVVIGDLWDSKEQIMIMHDIEMEIRD